MKKILAAAFGLILLVSPAFSQKKGKKDKPVVSTAPAPVKSDSTKKKGGLQPYKQLINSKTKTKKGLFTTHKINEDYYFEI